MDFVIFVETLLPSFFREIMLKKGVKSAVKKGVKSAVDCCLDLRPSVIK